MILLPISLPVFHVLEDTKILEAAEHSQVSAYLGAKIWVNVMDIFEEFFGLYQKVCRVADI